MISATAELRHLCECLDEDAAEKLLAAARLVLPDHEDAGRTKRRIDCFFCQRAEEEREARAGGWEPSFLVDGAEVDRPVCPPCKTSRLKFAPVSGMWEHKK
jgi:hypothetical protein